jgi:hypothetical protein
MILLIFGDPCPCNIHHPNRLKILESEKEVSGVVRGVKSELDGDIHIRLYIEDKSLLTINNQKDEDGCLVLEIVCAKESIFSTCKNYKSKIPIPKVGDSIQVSGPYVYDKIHGINEIHPVCSLVIR